jgi:hypothetical protein
MNSILHTSKNANTVPNFKLRSARINFLLSVALVVIAFSPVSAQCILSGAPANTAVWTGEVSSDWCNSANWACGKVPDGAVNTIIPAGSTNMPVVTCTFSFNAYTANIDVQPGATLTIPSNKTLNISGTFLNKDESRYVLTGRINFFGADQSVPAFTYNSLTVSGGGVKSLEGNATVNGSLVLTKGILATGNNNALTLGYRGIITAGYSTSYIDGSFTRLTNSSRTYNFPVGANGIVRTVLVSPEEETNSAYTVTYHHSIVPNNGVFGCTNLIANQENEFWDVNRAGSSANALVQIDYVNPEVAANWSNNNTPSDASNVAIIQNNAGSWSYNADASMGLQAIESTPGQINAQLGSKLVSDFSHFTFGYGYAALLPVNMLSFTAALQADASKISWSIEQGNDVVTTELQHGTDEKHFEKLTTVEAGNGNVINYTHNKLTAGAHFYRLMIKDKARNISYSKTILVIVPDYITKIKGLKATLVRGEASVKLESARNQNIGINLYDNAGHLVAKQMTAVQAGENMVNVKTLMITPGIYNMYVQTADGVTASLRFMKE